MLVVQDVFSRFLWTEALTSKRPDVVLEGLRAILQRAGAKPQSLTADQGTEFGEPSKTALEAEGISVYTKDPQDINAIATIDTAIGNFKKALVRDTRRLGTDDWASRIDKVTKGQNQTPNDEYLKGAAPADVSSDPDLIRYLQRKNAEFADYNQERIEARKGKLEEAGKFRGMESTGGKFTRGFNYITKILIF